jgi:hypothetical protein
MPVVTVPCERCHQHHPHGTTCGLCARFDALEKLQQELIDALDRSVKFGDPPVWLHEVDPE